MQGSQNMLAKVRALLDTAESYDAQGNAEAASTYRTKAHELRGKYLLEEEELIAQEPTAVTPGLIPVTVVGQGSPFQQKYVNMYSSIARHAGVRVHFEWSPYVPGAGYTVIAQTVGYEADIRYAEMIYTSARLVFTDRLEPKVSPSLSEQVNVYRLRAAGMERVRVAEAMWGNREKASLAKVGRLYKAECRARGEEALLSGRGVTGAVYREQYAEEFVWALRTRLRRTQDAAGQFGGGLVLHGRQERVDEAFYERYSDYRPKPAIEQATPVDCEACKRTKHDSKLCRDHRPRSATKSEIAALSRYNSPAARRGREAGKIAAAYVELTRNGRNGIEE